MRLFCELGDNDAVNKRVTFLFLSVLSLCSEIIESRFVQDVFKVLLNLNTLYCLLGRLLHLKTEEAFLRDPPDYLSYFYNCQFPSHVIDVLRDSDSRHCDVGSAIQTRLLNDNSPKISDILKQNIRKLLDLVDKCVTRFGKQVVLYDTEPSKR